MVLGDLLNKTLWYLNPEHNVVSNACLFQCHGSEAPSEHRRKRRHASHGKFHQTARQPAPLAEPAHGLAPAPNTATCQQQATLPSNSDNILCSCPSATFELKIGTPVAPALGKRSHQFWIFFHFRVKNPYRMDTRARPAIRPIKTTNS